MVRIATYQPRERPETTRNFLYQFLILSVCIAPYLPREGTETQVRYQTALNSDSIETYQPREGPETRTAVLRR